MSNQIMEIYHSLQEIAWQFGSRGINGECCEDLSFIEFMALKRIIEADEISVQEVGNQLNITKSGATKIINRLEQKGYVAKKNSAADGRVCCLRATDNGNQIINRIISKNTLYLEKILKPLDPNTITEIEAA
jgi:DNA-binding MarR family transcriptional regulator